MTRFFKENLLFVTSFILLCLLIAGAFKLQTMHNLKYAEDILPTTKPISSTPTTTSRVSFSKPVVTIGELASTVVPTIVPVTPTVIPKPTKPTPTPASIKPSTRNHDDDD